MRSILSLLIGLVISVSAKSQYFQTNTFTTQDELPSNWVYGCIPDSKGFLWIATDQGIVRFDGKNFQVFTSEHGLADNDVLVLLRNSNGEIWTKGSNNGVAKFDSVHTQFVNGNHSELIRQLDGKSYTRPFVGVNGSIHFSNLDTSFIVQGDKILSFPKRSDWLKQSIFMQLQQNSALRIVTPSSSPNQIYLMLTQNLQTIDSCLISKMDKNSKFFIDRSSIYIVDKTKNYVEIFTVQSFKPLQLNVRKMYLRGNYYWQNFSNQYIMFMFQDGMIDIYDKSNLNLYASINCNDLPLGITNDIEGNFWVGTMNKGLLLFKRNGIYTLENPSKKQYQSWLSVVRIGSGRIYAGSSSGEIVEYYQNGHSKLHLLKNAGNDHLIRTIISSQQKLISFGEGGIFINFEKKIVRDNPSCKAAYELNDSIILCAFKDSVAKLNTKTNKLSVLRNISLEASGMSSDNGDDIYIGTNSGLHIYRISSSSEIPLKFQSGLLNQRVISIIFTPDHLAWISTATNGIIVMNDTQIVKHISVLNGLPTNTISSMVNGKKGEVWLGSNQGITRIKYLNQSYEIRHLTVKDGLPSNSIHQLYYSNDTLYAATQDGVAIIPSNLIIRNYKIPIVLTGVKINDRDTIISNSYDLSSNQRHIQLQISGIELTGHFLNAQYSTDFGKNWNGLQSNILNLQLEHGTHNIWFRAIDVNGIISNDVLQLTFEISTPFYRTIWFIISIALILIALSAKVVSWYTKRKQQKQIEVLLNQQALDELEIQALKAQMNPHFVFNCLNSIKGFIYDEDFENADIYLDKFSQLLRSTLEFSSRPSIPLFAELNYIDTYLTLEKVRFGDKFNYEIICDENLNKQEIFVPAMLFQPFVENSIKHGVCNLENKLGRIILNFYLLENKLHVEIDDNGIGREAADLIKGIRTPKHQSKGTLLTQRRIELYKIDLRIVDKKDQNNKSSGTLIHVTIPIPLT